MKLLLALMKHETNTFSPVVTDRKRFFPLGEHDRDAAVKAYRGQGCPLGAYLDLAEAAGHEVVLATAAEAMPSGTVQEEAYEHIVGKILDAVKEGGVDACLLDLHGAMVAEHTDDGEGTLLERIRAIAPELPIAVTYDLHGNLTQKMFDNCTCLIGYKTYPHVDMREVGAQIAKVMLDALEGKCRPVMAWGQAPLLSQTLRQGHDDEPMKGLQDLCREAEAHEGVLAATCFGGFALADFKDAGSSVCVVADGDLALAELWRDRLLARLWATREEHIYQKVTLAESVSRAKALGLEGEGNDGPVVLLDHADNCGSGGTQDVMDVIREVMRQGLEDVAVAVVYDPEAVITMQKAGIGAEVTLQLGGHIDMPSIGQKGAPLEVTGRVKVLSDGAWTIAAPPIIGAKVTMGHAAVLDTGNVEIVVSSKHYEVWDAGVFTSVGILPKTKRYLVLKSRIHYRAGFAEHAVKASRAIACDGSGVTTSDNAQLGYRHVRRPVYPLDASTDESALVRASSPASTRPPPPKKPPSSGRLWP